MKTVNPCSSSSEKSSAVALAQKAATILKENASEVDTLGLFPERSMHALKQAGLMGLLIPERLGGMGESYSTMSKVAQVLSRECLSTAMIWAMHCQQAAVLVNHVPDLFGRPMLSQIAEDASYLASVTSENAKGGHLLTAHSPLVFADNDALLTREAPTVTGGLHGDAYLITMRAGESSSPSEVVMAYARRDQLKVTKTRDWTGLGMRGTESVGISLRGRIPQKQLLNKPSDFKNIAITTMIPVGHIAWASCWLGAARGAYRRTVAVLRDPAYRRSRDSTSDLLSESLARIRLDIDAIDALLVRTIQEYEHLRRDPANSYEAISSPSFQLRVNGLKIFASERSFQIVNQLIEIMGMNPGYLEGNDLGLDRVLRDLRSASLMYSNSRLLIANGKIARIEPDDLGSFNF